MMSSATTATAADLVLVERARTGDAAAFRELWARHHGAVTAATRSFTAFDAEDIAQEAFTKVFAQIQAGGGPDTAFRAYLAQTARNIAIDMARREGRASSTSLDEDDLPAVDDHSEQVLTGTALARAYESLPQRWREVLWYRDVEDLPVKECALFVGLSENSTTALIKRAREGLKQAWIAAQLDTVTSLTADCAWVVDRLPRYTRGRATPADSRRVAEHLTGCAECSRLAENSSAIHKQLAAAILPFLLLGGSASYLEWIQERQNAPAPLPAVASRSTRAAVPLAAAAAVVAGTLLIVPSASESGPLVSPNVQVRDAADDWSSPFDDVDLVELISPARDDRADEDTAGPSIPAAADAPAHTEPTPPDADEPGEPGVDEPPVDEPPLDEPPFVAPPGEEPPGEEPPAEEPPALPDAAIIQPVTLPAASDLERGVYPRLVGQASSDATLQLTLVDEYGATLVETVIADSDGGWEYTVHTLRGAVTVTVAQTYRTGGAPYDDPAVASAVYEVGPYLSLELVAFDLDMTRIYVHGLPSSAERPHVVTLESSIPELNRTHSYLRSGGNWFLVSLPIEQINQPIRFWQGTDQTSAVQVWMPPGP